MFSEMRDECEKFSVFCGADGDILLFEKGLGWMENVCVDVCWKCCCVWVACKHDNLWIFYSMFQRKLFDILNVNLWIAHIKEVESGNSNSGVW